MGTQQTAPVSGRADGAGEPATALVVDDTTRDGLPLAGAVAHEGYRVLRAPGGRAALEVLQREHVDVVLLDLANPDGADLIAAIRQNTDLGDDVRDVPVIVVPAADASDGMTDDLARALGMGAVDILSEPLDPIPLRTRLRAALAQARLRHLERACLDLELALRQHERLATLGRLTAGLGHELNNPAAAALSTARHLRAAVGRSDELLPRILDDPSGPDLVTAVTAALAGRAEEPAYDRAEEIADVLEARGVEDPWAAADHLADAGLTGEGVGHALGTGADPALALEWLTVRADVQVSLDRIGSSVGRMTDLTSALRTYSHLDRAPQRDVDVRRGLDDAIAILAHKVPEHVTFRREYAGDLPTIEAYGGQLHQVWTNIVDNALDAVDDAGTVVVRARPEDGGVLVEVEDDGGGIPSDIVEHVFEPFVTSKEPGRGTGLGLDIAHQIVTDVHGGRLSVSSEPGRTVFAVWLPPTPPERTPAEGEADES